MKKTILVIASMVATVSMMAQANLMFGNKATGVTAPVTHKEDGAMVEGGDYLATLYWGQKGAAADALTPVVDSTTGGLVAIAFRAGAAKGFITSTAVSISGAASGVDYAFQMRAWSKNGGATYEAAYAAATTGGMASSVKLGSSNVFTQKPNLPPATPQPLVGLEAFTIAYIPEPSILALGLLGGLAFLLRRR